MIYESQGFKINLEYLTRLYPAAVVKMGDEETHVSLEWADLKESVVSIVSYILVFDVDPLGKTLDHRIILYYNNRQELEDAMKEVALLLEGNN